MPFIEQTYDISDEDKHCACGCALTHIGNDTSEQLDVEALQHQFTINLKLLHA